MTEKILKNFPARLFKMTDAFYQRVPSGTKAHKFIDELINLLFLVRDEKSISLEQIEYKWAGLQVDFLHIIAPHCCKCKCSDVAEKFFAQLPLIYINLLRDSKMYSNSDPASYCKEEVILCYPGFYAVAIYRIAHVIHSLGIPILPRVISEYAHSKTGIDIHPGAKIGRGFYIDHGTGVVIGETCVIGKNVKIYQGVTLGATFVGKELSGVRRHPTIEDNVIIYAGSTILGGDTVIGKDTVIGGNVWLTESVPPGSMVYHRPEIVIKDRK